jgi:phosphotriesterase-related protein
LHENDACRALLPKWSYTHLFDDVLPALQTRGVTENQIRQLFVENPRRIFEHAGPY